MSSLIGTLILLVDPVNNYRGIYSRGVAGQSAEDCDGQVSPKISIVDDSGTIPIPNATVVLRWTGSDAVRKAVRQKAQVEGRLFICTPDDARQATLWAELGDASSEEASVPPGGAPPDARR